jgi:Icc-related predicted phosphoesterase
MKFLVVSDLHGNLQRIEQLLSQIHDHAPDIIVICGDLTHYGSISDIADILKKFSTSSIPIVFVPGNLDPISLQDQVKIQHTTNLHGKRVDFKSYIFIGLGGSVYTPFHTRFELSENEIKTLLDKIFNQLPDQSRHILVSHNPPYDTQLDVTSSGDHVGSKALRDFIITSQPILVMCGHIHEASSIDQLNNSVLINPGPLFDGYFGVVEIDQNDIIQAKLCQL